MVFNALLSAIWTLSGELQRRIQAMEIRCYRKILHISYKDHVTNEEVRAKIQQAIGPDEDLLTIVKRRKLQRYGHVSRSSDLTKHVSRSSDLTKTILQGTVKGGRRRGGQRKRWEDNIREWPGLEFSMSQRAVENREKWRKLVAKSSVVPQRPSRLRDWWWWWWYGSFSETVVQRGSADPNVKKSIENISAMILIKKIQCQVIKDCITWMTNLKSPLYSDADFVHV